MKPFAVIDIGTNSIRLGVVQPEPNLAYSVLSQQKEVVRLGEGEFASNRLTPAAMERGLLVLRRFVEVARGFGAEEITVLATSALREAENQAEFVERARDEAGVEVRVIPGAEEARLIYLGVVSGLELGSQRALVMDIGGGSTELATGDNAGPDQLESMKLGAIRLGGIFTEGETGPIKPSIYRRIQEYVRAVSVHCVQRIRESGFDVMYGSSGTILNLVEIVARSRGEGVSPGYFVSLEDLEAQAARLAGMPLEQRRRVPGINPERADIIVAGAAVLTTVMRELEAPGLFPSDRALREGLIVDRLGRMGAGSKAILSGSVRERSVFQLARRCQFEEEHARQVARLACSLFDQLRDLRLHGYGEAERELLHYASILHDIGGFISYTDHHRHGYYLVRHSPLLGFDTTEAAIMAAVVLHHRKALPKRKEEATAEMSRKERQLVTVLCVLLRMAESLDRGHLGSVRGVRCALEKGGEELVVELQSDRDCHLELWGLQNHRAAVAEVFGRRLVARSACGTGNPEGGTLDTRYGSIE